MKKFPLLTLLAALTLLTASSTMAAVVFQDDFDTYNSGAWLPAATWWPWAYNAGEPFITEAVVEDGRTALHMQSNGLGPASWDGISSWGLIVPVAPYNIFTVVYKVGQSAPANSALSIHNNCSGAPWGHSYAIPTWNALVGAGAMWGWQGVAGTCEYGKWYTQVWNFNPTGSTLQVYESGNLLWTGTSPYTSADVGVMAWVLAVANGQGSCEVWVDSVKLEAFVPEPSSFLALGGGLLSLLGFAAKVRKK